LHSSYVIAFIMYWPLSNARRYATAVYAMTRCRSMFLSVYQKVGNKQRCMHDSLVF